MSIQDSFVSLRVKFSKSDVMLIGILFLSMFMTFRCLTDVLWLWDLYRWHNAKYLH